MFEIVFYTTDSGREPVREFLVSLRRKKDKRTIIERDKISKYLQRLIEHGTRAGEPYIKKLDGEIWELRPLKNRILFFCWTGTEFVLLHHFIKKTQKTPLNEIEQAKRNMKKFILREVADDK
jgi:phage-related protein